MAIFTQFTKFIFLLISGTLSKLYFINSFIQIIYYIFLRTIAFNTGKHLKSSLKNSCFSLQFHSKTVGANTPFSTAYRLGTTSLV